MRALQKMKLIETVIVVERHDMIAVAQKSRLWPPGGKAVEAWMKDDDCLHIIKVHVPEPEEGGAA